MIYTHSKHLQNLLMKNNYKLSITNHTKERYKLMKERRLILREINVFKIALNSTYGRLRNDPNK